MKKTKEQVRAALGLLGLPDDEFMRLLEDLGDGPVVTGTVPVGGKDWSAKDIVDALNKAEAERLEARDAGEARLQ